MSPESQHLEYKRELTESLERTVVGFLNSRDGGRILQAYSKACFRFTDNFIRIVFPVAGNIEKISYEKVGEKVGEKLSGNQMQIVKMLELEPHMSAKLLADHLGISLRKTEENLKKLRERSIIRRVGPARGGYWEVLK